MKAAAQKGTVLLLALLIMTSVIITSAGLGSLILSSLQQTRIIDNAMIAYYAAESGVEQALYQTRRLAAPPGTVASQVLGNGASWNRIVAGSERTIYATIPENSLYEVALFDPDAEDSALTTPIRVIEVNWPAACDGPCPILHATLVSWQPQNPIIWDPNAVVYKFTAPPALLTLDTNKLYKLRLRAEKNDMEQVRIKAYQDDGLTQEADLPGRIVITSVGEHVGVRQRVVASVPRRTPLSGVYDFVIFSECSLIKGGAGISCP
jgi:hypothetical protein